MSKINKGQVVKGDILTNDSSLNDLSDVDYDFGGGSPRPQAGDMLIFTDVEGTTFWASRTVGLDPNFGYGAGSMIFRRGSPTSGIGSGFDGTTGLVFQEGSPRGMTIFGKISLGGNNGPQLTGTGANFSTATQPILAISRKNKLTGIGGVASGSPLLGTVTLIINAVDVAQATNPDAGGLLVRNGATGGSPAPLERVLTVSDIAVVPGSPATFASPLTVQGTGSPLPIAAVLHVQHRASVRLQYGIATTHPLPACVFLRDLPSEQFVH